MSTVNELRQALAEDVTRLQPAAGLESRILRRALQAQASVGTAMQRSGRRGALRSWDSKSTEAPRLMALIAAMLAVAIVASFIVVAHALHSRSSIPAHAGPSPQAQPRPIHTEVCRAQCGVAAQQALQPQQGTIRQCVTRGADGCAVQAPFFATASLGWITNSYTGPDGPAFLYWTDDAGQLWRPVLSWDGPGAQQIRSSADGKEALVVTAWGSHPGTIFHTTDGGAHWTAHGLPVGTAADSVVYFLNAREGWVLSENLDLIHTADSGSNWTRIARLDGVQQGGSLHFLTPSDGLYIQGPTVDVTHDGGATWGAISPARPNSVPASAYADHAVAKFFSSQDGVLEFVYCTIASCPSPAAFAYTTSDGGNNWSDPVRLPAGVARTIFIDTNHWIGMFGDFMAVRSVIQTADAGQHWAVLVAPGSPSSSDWGEPMDFTDPLHGWALGSNGGYNSLLITSDGGMTWTARPLPS